MAAPAARPHGPAGRAGPRSRVVGRVTDRTAEAKEAR